ncbi:hypothetical protein T484DRAFT_1879478, partial [Baffinella frigidus]
GRHAAGLFADQPRPHYLRHPDHRQDQGLRRPGADAAVRQDVRRRGCAGADSSRPHPRQQGGGGDTGGLVADQGREGACACSCHRQWEHLPQRGRCGVPRGDASGRGDVGGVAPPQPRALQRHGWLGDGRVVRPGHLLGIPRPLRGAPLPDLIHPRPSLQAPHGHLRRTSELPRAPASSSRRQIGGWDARGAGGAATEEDRRWLRPRDQTPPQAPPSLRPKPRDQAPPHASPFPRPKPSDQVPPHASPCPRAKSRDHVYPYPQAVISLQEWGGVHVCCRQPHPVR